MHHSRQAVKLPAVQPIVRQTSHWAAKEKKYEKSILFLYNFITFLEIVYSQDIKLAAIACQDMLLDQKDSLRYSVLNTIDNNSGNVYAVENVKTIKGKVFIGFYLEESVKIDSIVLEHGYFDSKYFDANNRLKVSVNSSLVNKFF